MSSPSSDRRIGGRFRVERQLGAGGMGAVYLARNLGLDQLVALKVLHPDAAQSGVQHSRMIREARAAASIRSAHVVRVIDVVGEGPDAPFVVMEYLEGETLRSMLDRRQRLPLSEVMELVSQIAEAIGEGHALGIVHRDLKPENLFRVEKPGGEPLYKVLDFGISKVRRAGAETLTSSRQVLASPAYAAPEQLRASRDADVPADIWSLGVVMYECLVGERPFNGETLGHLCVQILEESPTPPSKRVPGLWPTVDEVVMRCLEKVPGQRFSSVAELLSACVPLAPAPCSRALAYLTGLASAAHPLEVRPSSPPRSAVPSPVAASRPAPEPSATSLAPSAPPRAVSAPPSSASTQTHSGSGLVARVVSAAPKSSSRVSTRYGAVLAAVLALAGIVGVTLWRSSSAQRNGVAPTSEASSSLPTNASSLGPPPSAPAAASASSPPAAISIAPVVPAAPHPVTAAAIPKVPKKIAASAPSAKSAPTGPAPKAAPWVESR